jgi:sulfur carrier protein ThiS
MNPGANDRLAPAQIYHRNQRLEVAAGQMLGQALDALGLPAELYLAIRDGELISEEAQLNPGDEVRLVGVTAGG